MRKSGITKVWISAFVSISSIFLGNATEWQIGASLFFALWAIAGMIELVEDKLNAKDQSL
jgi:hypothetical protein